MYFLMKKKIKHFFIKNKPTGASFTQYYVHFIIFNIAFTLFILIILDVPLVFVVQGRLIRRFLNYRLMYCKKKYLLTFTFLCTQKEPTVPLSVAVCLTWGFHFQNFFCMWISLRYLK